MIICVAKYENRATRKLSTGLYLCQGKTAKLLDENLTPKMSVLIDIDYMTEIYAIQDNKLKIYTDYMDFYMDFKELLT